MTSKCEIKLTDENVVQALNGDIQNPVLSLFDVLKSEIDAYRAEMPDCSVPSDRYNYLEDKFGFFPKQIDELKAEFELSSTDLISIYARTLKEGLYNPEFSSIFKSTALKFASQNLQGKCWNGIARYMHSNLSLPDEVHENNAELQEYKLKILEIDTMRKLIKEYDRGGLSTEHQKQMRNLSHIISQTSFESMLY